MHLLGSKRTFDFNRRSVIKGTGVAMALPWMETMFWGAEKQTRPIKRFAAIWMPNGVNDTMWEPKGSGANYELSPTLKPLQKLKQDFLVLSNLSNVKAKESRGNGHWPRLSSWLSCETINFSSGKDLRCGTTIDQIMAKKIGKETPLSSIELSMKEGGTGIDTLSSLSAVYGAHISWSSPSVPVPREVDSQVAFDRIFGKSTQFKYQGSLLDLVRSDAKNLKQKISRHDQHRLDAFLSSVRELEEQIQKQSLKSKPVPKSILEHRDEMKMGRDLEHHFYQKFKLMAMAFQIDRTRVATLMMGNGTSGFTYPFLEETKGRSFHQLSHHSGNKEKLLAYGAINRYHVLKFAEFLTELKNMKEGGSNVLYNSMILLGSSLRDGNSHSPYNLPTILAGHGGGSLKPGRYLTYKKDTPFSNLHLTLLNHMGVSTSKFSDSTNILSDLS